MKNHIDSNFAIAIIVLVSACLGFAFWISGSLHDIDSGSTVGGLSANPKVNEVTVDSYDMEKYPDLKKTFLSHYQYREYNSDPLDDTRWHFLSGDDRADVIVDLNYLFLRKKSGDLIDLNLKFEEGISEPQVIFAVNQVPKAIVIPLPKPNYAKESQSSASLVI